MRNVLALLGTLLAFYGLSRLTYDASYIDPHDHVSCDVYRVGTHEINVCSYRDGCTAESCE